MSIKVKEVLELAQSKGCTLAAGEGGIDRIVRFVDCMEIPDMKAWMRPNVLYITTGYAYSDTKEEIMNLIRNLYEAKAAALATKYRYIGCFLDDAIKLANELQFPIILWPEDLPFIEMNYLVMEALIKSQNNLMDSIYSRIEKYNRREMDKRLFAQRKKTMVLDGDNVRMGLNGDLGFRKEDREENIRRVAEVAKLMNDAGIIVLTSFISPFEADRQKAREIIGEDSFIEIYVSTPLEECEKRDVKGLYKKARQGKITDFSGISSPYEVPRNADIMVDTSGKKIEDCVDEIMEQLSAIMDENKR